jgi:hypothetical protein
MSPRCTSVQVLYVYNLSVYTTRDVSDIRVFWSRPHYLSKWTAFLLVTKFSANICSIWWNWVINSKNIFSLFSSHCLVLTSTDYLLVTCRGDYWRGVNWRLPLLNTYTHDSNYTQLQRYRWSPHFAVHRYTHILVFSVFTSRILATAFNTITIRISLNVTTAHIKSINHTLSLLCIAQFLSGHLFSIIFDRRLKKAP